MSLYRSYRAMSYEERLIARTVVTMSAGAVIAAGKLVIGLFTDYMLCAVAAFNALLLCSKLGCVLGAKQKGEFARLNARNAVFLFCAGLVYTLYMGAALIFDITPAAYPKLVSIAIAAIAFTEMGLAVYGLHRTKRKERFYRNIKIVSFVSALTAIMTAQIALLSFNESGNSMAYNSYTGMGIGIVTMLLAVYVYFAPRLSTIGRERSVFVLTDGAKNRAVDMRAPAVELRLVKSRVYGDWVYRAVIEGRRADGRIEQTAGLWNRLHVVWKILCILLSEILVFVWAIGYAVYFVRTVDLPGKLQRRMEENGFARAADSAEG